MPQPIDSHKPAENKKQMVLEAKELILERTYHEQIADELVKIMEGGVATQLRQLAQRPTQTDGHLQRMERLKRAAEAAYLAAQEAASGQ